MLSKAKKAEILEKARAWWRDELAISHRENTLKLSSLEEFNINPFLWSYLAYFLEGNNKPKSLAKVLIYPRILGTSVNTIFGVKAQEFVSRIFKGTFGSTTPGIDLEFIDQIDGRKKYCQIKAGPNVINHDDVTTIKGHFRSAINIARTNHLPVQIDDYLLCLLYGEPSEKNGFVKEVEQDYRVAIGKEFWHRFTGDPKFYKDLISTIGEVASEFNMKETVDSVINDLSKEIKKKFGDLV